MPPLDLVYMSVFNAVEREFLNKMEKLLGTGDNWEAHVAQQIPLPRKNSPTHTNKQPGSLEQLEVSTEDEMDIGEFSERPANDMRPSKPPRKTKAYIQDVIPPPECEDYMAMDHTVIGIPKPPLPDIRSLLMDKRKLLIGWPACMKRSPAKAAFNNSNIYMKSTENVENLYEEPLESKANEEGQEPKEKNMEVFCKLNVNDNINVTSNPYKEEFNDQNYKMIEDQETAL